MTAFEIILLCFLVPITYVVVYLVGKWNLIGRNGYRFRTKKNIQADYDRMYGELWELLKDLREWYSIDEANSYGVHIWTKGEESEPLFDIYTDKIVMRKAGYEIVDDAKMTVEKIRDKLREIDEYWYKRRSVK